MYPWKPAADDDLYGGPGDDTYLVLEPSDAAIERPNEGYDTVQIYDTDYTLGPNVERLVRHPLDHTYGRFYTGNEQDNDIDTGGGGGDVIAGRGGADRLSGGYYGGDIFDYDDVAESRPGPRYRDVITHFSEVGGTTGDQIDLSGIYAIAGGSDDAFTFVGTGAFITPGQVRVQALSATSTDTLIQVNTMGTSGAELEIVVADADAEPEAWTANDFNPVAGARQQDSAGSPPADPAGGALRARPRFTSRAKAFGR